MNIFVLDRDIEKCAKSHCDKHVVKMILETAQILSSALQLHGCEKDDLYRLTHKHHPCVKWTAASKNNFLWLCRLGEELGKEYTRRYNKDHKSVQVIKIARSKIDYIPDGDLTDFALAMPDQYKNEDPVLAYRQYYKHEKQSIAAWKYSETPEWWNTDSRD